MRVDHGSLAWMREFFRRALSSVIGLLSMHGASSSPAGQEPLVIQDLSG
jgi:hypothetical protein